MYHKKIIFHMLMLKLMV